MKSFIALFALASLLKYGDSAFTGWSTPLISTGDGSGSVSINENQVVGATSITLTALVDTGSIASYTDTSSSTVFTIASATGVISLASALSFATTPSYTLTIEAVDDTAGPNTATATVTIIVNTAPTFAVSTYGATIADASTAGTTVTTYTATDGNTDDTLTYAIASGDSNNHFEIAAGVITVSTGTTIAASSIGGYALEITATDTGSLVATSTVYVAVTTCSGAKAVLAGSFLVMLMALIAFLK